METAEEMLRLCQEVYSDLKHAALPREAAGGA